MFNFVVVYDIDGKDLFTLTSDKKKEREEDTKVQKKIFENIGSNRNKQLLIAPFLNRLDEVAKKLQETLNVSNSEEECLWM